MLLVLRVGFLLIDTSALWINFRGGSDFGCHFWKLNLSDVDSDILI